MRNKINEVEDAEKKAVVSSLMIKCNKTKEEVLEAYDDFHLKHTDGSIQNEEYISSAPITVCIILLVSTTFLLHSISSVSVRQITLHKIVAKGGPFLQSSLQNSITPKLTTIPGSGIV